MRSPLASAGRRRLAAVTTGLVGLAGAALVVPSAAHADDTAPVAAGVTPAAAPQAVVFGDTDPNTPETVSFVLKMKHEDALARAVANGLQTKDYITVSQFAAKYGQSDDTIKQVTDYLAGFGITTEVYPNKINVVAHGTAGQFDKALQVTQQEYHVPSTTGHDGHHHPAQDFHGTTQAPRVPSDWSAQVSAILGLTNYSPFRTDAHSAADAGFTPDATSSDDCVKMTGLPNGCHTPKDFADRYHLSPLYKKANGKGRTVGIVTLATADPGAPEYFWKNVLGMTPTGRTLTYTNVDGGSGAPSDKAGSPETDLDIEQSGAVAPGANIVVYQAPNTDYGFVDSYMKAASENVADSISASWGMSEDAIQAGLASGQVSGGYQGAFDEAFLELAAQGQSNFTSSADQGAYTATNDLGSTNLSADMPANSPFVTAAGGTTLPWTGTVGSGAKAQPVSVTAERAWGWDYLWAPLAKATGKDLLSVAKTHIEGGGGGYSVLEPRPSFQFGDADVSQYSAVQWLNSTTPKDFGGITRPSDFTINPSPAVTTGENSKGRAIPDISTNADPLSGYLLWAPSSKSTLQGAWGGTSFVSPQLDAAAVVIDQYAGHRTGLWNPALYDVAAEEDGTVTPLNATGADNDNLYFTGTKDTEYNPATGLGIPNLKKLANLLS